MSFTYNDEGFRLSKTVNGATTTYLYDCGVLIAEYTPTYTCVYIYDESGAIIGAKYISTEADSTWQTYLFEKNLQGDVIAVYSDTGTKLISYRYDAWGNRTTTYSNGGASTLAANNPITYRGYYYDTDLGMYYLQSRYYDAKICRFINADSYVSTGQGILGYNMFAYCGNNPVNRIDPTGEVWWVITAVAAIIVVCTVVLSSCSQSKNSNFGAASPYTASNSKEYNCYAYALGEDQWKYVGGSSDAVQSFDVDIVAEMVLSDAQRDGRTMRIIDSFDSPIESNEYRIAPRTGDADYHFMLQHSDGTWSHKPGMCSTRLINGANPSVISWDLPQVNTYLLYWFGIVEEVGYIENYYDSKIIYFAVSR